MFWCDIIIMLFGDVVRPLVLLRVVMTPHICGAIPYSCGSFLLKINIGLC